MKSALLFLVLCIAFVSAQTNVNVTDLKFSDSYTLFTNGTTYLFMVTYTNGTFNGNIFNAYLNPNTDNSTFLNALSIGASYQIQNSTTGLTFNTTSAGTTNSSVVSCVNYTATYSSVQNSFAWVQVVLQPVGGDNTGIDVDIEMDVADNCSTDNFGGTSWWIWALIILAVILVIVVIVGGIAVFLVMQKRKQSNYALYNDS